MVHGKLTKEKLADLYIKKKLSTYAIAERYKCDPKTIYFHLKRNGIVVRKKRIIHIPQSELRRLYLVERKSLSEIGRAYGFSPAGILKKFKHYGITRRSISETSTKHKKFDFNGDTGERAYVIGFRLGDLGVRKINNLIHVSSSTTKEAQDKLIRELFENYGPIWTSKKNEKSGAWNLSCSLNDSFAFLLPKYKRIPKSILESDKHMLAFTAGYTDAEGNFQISGGTARFRIRSYDTGILTDLHRWLTRYGVPHTFSLVSKAGIRRNGVRHNKDCWGITVANKGGLKKLLPTLVPLLRHTKRRRDAELAMDNVKRRML